MLSSVSEAAIQSLSDRMTGLSDMIASNSTAQVPIIDTLQALVNRIDSPPRDRAEKSLRDALGDAVYIWLDDSTRTTAIEAELRAYKSPHLKPPPKLRFLVF